MYRYFVLVLLILITACDGGGGDDGNSNSSAISSNSGSASSSGTYDIRSDQEQVSLSVQHGDVRSTIVTITFDGDGVIAGSLPSITNIPSWLSVNQYSPITSTGDGYQVDFEFVAQATSSGQFSATIRFITGDQNGNNIAYIDIPVSLDVYASIEYSIIAGQVLPDPIALPYRLDVTNTNYTTEINDGNLGWLEIENDNGQLLAKVVRTDLAPGSEFANVIITAGSQIYDFDITLEIIEPNIELHLPDTITIDNSTTNDDLLFNADVITNYDLISWEIVETSELINIIEIKPDSIRLSIDKSKLVTVSNGIHEERVEISYQLPNSSGSTAILAPLNVTVNFTEVESVTPRVVYLGEATPVRIYGNHIDSLENSYFSVNGTQLTNINRLNSTELEAIIPAELEAQKYFFSTDNALGIQRKNASLVIKSHPNFPIQDLILPGRPSQIIFDAEREQFYFSSTYSTDATYQISFDNTGWKTEALPISWPGGLALNLDNTKLLVGTYTCELWELTLDILEMKSPYPPSDCFNTSFGLVGQLYTGLTLIADAAGWSTMWTYPNWKPTPLEVPREHNPFGVVSQNGTHMIWAGGPSVQGDVGAYMFNARTEEFHKIDIQADDYYLQSLFSLSANGEVFSHFDDIYDAQLQFIGSLTEDPKRTSSATGISPDGTMAGTYSWGNDSIRVFDISRGFPFTELALGIALNTEATGVSKIMFSEDNQYMFVFAHNNQTGLAKLYVHKL